VAKEKYLCAKTANLEVIIDVTGLWNKRTIVQIPNMFLENDSFLRILWLLITCHEFVFFNVFGMHFQILIYRIGVVPANDLWLADAVIATDVVACFFHDFTYLYRSS